jgi:hypothetical protein
MRNPGGQQGGKTLLEPVQAAVEHTRRSAIIEITVRHHIMPLMLSLGRAVA